MELAVAAPPSARENTPVTAIIRAQKLQLGAPERAGALRGKVASTSYLGGSAAYFVDMGGIRLQSIATIDDRVWREGEEVSISVAPGDVLLLDESGHRLR